MYFVFLAVNIYQFISPASKADILRMLQCVQTVSGFDPLHQGISVIRAVYQVNTCLVQSHRIIGCQNPNIVHIRFCRVSVAVTVDRQVIHNADIHNVSIQGIYYRFACLGHRLQEGILFTAPGTCMALSRRVDQALALLRSKFSFPP